jgi:hypothetical protein
MSLVAAYPVRVVCAVLDLPRSTFYYQPAPPAADDTPCDPRSSGWPGNGRPTATVG